MGWKEHPFCCVVRAYRYTARLGIFPSDVHRMLKPAKSSFLFMNFDNPRRRSGHLIHFCSGACIMKCSVFSTLPAAQMIQTGMEQEQTLDDAEKVCHIIRQNCEAGQDMESSLDKCGVKMTPQLVEKVLAQFKFQEKAAFRFFTWAGRQEGYRHVRHTINEMIDILSNTRYKSRQFSLICALLEQKKTMDNLPVEVFVNILREHAEKNLKLPEKRVRTGRIKSIKAKLEVNSLNILLDSLCKCNLVLEAQNLFEKLKGRFKPNARTYTVLLYGWCRIKRPNKAMQVMNEMIDTAYEPDCFTYNTLLAAFCNEGELDAALNLFHLMKGKGYARSSPIAKTFQIMIVELAKADRTEEAMQMLDEMRNSGCVPDVPTYTQIIAGLCGSGKISEAYRILDGMADKGYPPDIVTYNCFMKALCNLNLRDEALNLLDQMTVAGCLPSTHTYNMLIKMLCELGQIKMAFEMWHDMHKKECVPDIFCYCTFIQGLFDNGRVEDGTALLVEVMDKHMKLPYHAYDSFLMELSKSGDLRMIERVSKYMKRFNHYRLTRRFNKFKRWQIQKQRI